MKQSINAKYAQVNELKNYLRSTDYQVIKSAESDYVMSDETLVERQAARDEINRLEYEISRLEEELMESEEAMDVQ